MHVVYGTWNAPWVKHLTQGRAGLLTKSAELYERRSSHFDTVFRSCERKPEKIQACTGFEPLTSWVPENFLSAVSVRFVASAYGRRCVSLRPTPKGPAAREKNLWYPGYCSSMTSKMPRRENEYAAERRTDNVLRIFVCILVLSK